MRQWQTDDGLEQEAYFMMIRFEDAPPLLVLPTDYPRSMNMDYEGTSTTFELSDTLLNELQQFATQHQMSLYMVMLTVLKVLLYHYTGEQKIVVGTLIVNLDKPQLEKGEDTIVVVTELSGMMHWQDAFALVKDSTLYSFQQAWPFETLVKAINPEEQLNYHPIFQVLFNLIDVPQSDVGLLGVSPMGLTLTNAIDEPFDLNISLRPYAGGLQGQFGYNKKLFKEQTIQRWIEHYKKLLALATHQLATPIGATDFLLSEEKELLFNQWFRTEIDYPRNETTIGKFETMALKYPNNIALMCGHQQMTYGELNDKASVVAKALVCNGAKPGDLIAICIERSFDMVIGLLGIWKSGAGYVPLNTSEPVNRLEYLLDKTKCNIVLTHQKTNITLAVTKFSGRIIQVDNLDVLKIEMTQLPIVRPEDVAYVLFTSGSTGKPKGVVIEHRSLWEYLWACVYEIKPEPEVRFLQLASYSFDAFLFDLYFPLISNAMVILPEMDKNHDLQYLAGLIVEKKVNIIKSVPSFLRPLSEALKIHPCHQLHTIYSVGEALLFYDVALLHANTGANIVNQYGPTETIGIVSQGHCAPLDKKVTIGRPIINSRLYILNEQLHAVPIGCYGELYIAKAHLARGYLNEDQLMADSFIQNPFVSHADQQLGRYLRLYKSGDKVRWLPDGRLQFAGRIDLQVKIRGQRVELGEIETVIVAHMAVQASAVIKHLEQLIAFVVLNQAVATKELHQYISDHLPSYMLPAHWIILMELPFTKTGKLDRKSLPALINPNEFDNHGNAYFIEPQTIEEIWLAAQWQKLLNIKRVGLNNNFFISGGHSLLLLQLIYEINIAFDLKLPIRIFLTEPTLAGQAREIKRAIVAKNQGQHIIYPSLVALRLGGRKIPFFFVPGGFGGEAELAVYAGLVSYFDSQQPVYGLRARGVDELVESHDTVKKMATEHIETIRNVQPHGPYLIGGGCIGGLVALEIAQQLQAAGESIKLLVFMDTTYPSWGKPLRKRFIKLWHNKILLLSQCWRQNPSKLYAMIIEQIRIRIAPSFEQKIGLKKVRIGQEYMNRIRGYVPSPYAGLITLILSEEKNMYSSTPKWRKLALGGLDIQYVCGNHVTHLREHAATTAARLEACLNREQYQDD